MKKLFTLALAMMVGVSMMYAQILEENFDAGSLPAGWSIQTNASDGGFVFGTAAETGSAYWGPEDNGTAFAVTNDDACDCDKSADYLISPELDLSDVAGAVLEFDAIFDGLTFGETEQAFVEYSTDGGTTWTVHTEIFGDDDEVFEWDAHSVNLSDLAGMSSVWVAFRYQDNGGWLYAMAIDNVVIFEPANDDVSIDVNLGGGKYNLTGTDVPVEYTITNVGANMVSSLDVSWTDGTNTYTDNLTSMDLMPGASVSYTHGTDVSIADAVKYNIDVTAENPNGVADANMGDNSASLSTYGLSFEPAKKVVAEEATGTWCGWCPRGFVFMEQLEEEEGDAFIGIAVHNGDPMAVTEYDDGLTSFPGFSGFPSVVWERTEVIDPSAMPAAFDDYIGNLTPVGVTVSVAEHDADSYYFDAKIQFATEMSASDYRYVAVLVENGVTGTGSGYNQANYYAGGGAGTMGGWEALSDPVPAADMVYDDVARAILGGWSGLAGPSDAVAGDVVQVTGNIDVTGLNFENVEIVFMVTDAETGEILNADDKLVGEVSSTEAIEALTDVAIMPNPSTGYAEIQLNFTETVDVQIDVLNTVGQTVYSAQYNNTLGDRYVLDLNNQASGVYNVRVTVDGQTHVERLVIQK